MSDSLLAKIESIIDLQSLVHTLPELLTNLVLEVVIARNARAQPRKLNGVDNIVYVKLGKRDVIWE